MGSCVSAKEVKVMIILLRFQKSKYLKKHSKYLIKLTKIIKK
jgi:hypothetical protein